MRISIEGDTFAPKTFRSVWAQRGFEIVRPEEADLVFVSTDTSIDKDGKREQESLREIVTNIYHRIHVPLVLTSQVTPGFTRSLNLPIFNMAETLRIKDAEQRAYRPDYFVFGSREARYGQLNIMTFAQQFDCACFFVTYEEAEFSKIAVNMTLASQVDNANRLSKAAKAVGADWKIVSDVISCDKRIGKQSYLTPGRWQDSQHLLRDYVTLKEIENG